MVEEGTTKADQLWLCTVNSGGTIGVTSVTWSALTFSLADGSVTLAKLANLANGKIIGRSTVGTGVPEALSLSQVLDLIGSAAQGDILYRDSSAWARLAAGTSGNFLKTQGAGANPTWALPAAGGPTAGTQQATTSGTVWQFTGIPSTAKRVTMLLNGVSFNTASSELLSQVGPSGGVVTTGYVGGGTTMNGSSAAVIASNTSTSGAQAHADGAARTATGRFVWELIDSSTNTWVCSWQIYDSVGPTYSLGNTKIALSGALERIRLTTSGGDTGDAGAVNIIYE